MIKLPNISIVIPAWNEETVLRDSLTSMDMLDYPKELYEIIVVAGGDDKTLEIAHDYSDKLDNLWDYVVIQQKGEGKNVAIQEGIKRSRGEIIVIIDADSTVDKNWLRKLINPLTEENFDAAGGTAFSKENNYISSLYVLIEHLANFVNKSGGLWHAAGVAIKRSVINSIGANELFKKDVFTGIDPYMSRILIQRGYRYKFVKDAKTFTDLPTGLKEFLKFQYRWVKSLYFIDKDKGLNIIFTPFKSLLIIVSFLSLLLLPSLSLPYVLAVLLISPFFFHMFIVFRNIYRVNRIEPSVKLYFYPGILLLITISHILKVFAFISFIFNRDMSKYKHFKGPRKL